MAFTSHTGQPGTGYFWNVGLNSCQCPQHPCWQGWGDPIFCLVTSLLKERSYRQSQATHRGKVVGTGPAGLTGACTLWVGLSSYFPASPPIFPSEGLSPDLGFSISLPFLKLYGFLEGYHSPPHVGPLTARQAGPILYTSSGCRHC